MRVGSAELPPWWRVMLAFAVAPTAAASIYAVFEPMYGGRSYIEQIWDTIPFVAIIGAYPPTLVLGVPLYLLLCRLIRPTYLACAIAGAAAAGLPWLVVFLLPAADGASMGVPPTMIDGHVTWYGVRVGFQMAGEAGVLGAIGGLVFRLVAGRGRTSLRAEGEATLGAAQR